jgi:hypothetical protein
MRIKKLNNNEYISAGGIWVRNFTKINAPCINIDSITKNSDYQKLLQNEQDNRQLGHGDISDESLVTENVIIASDGYDFSNRQEFISRVPNNVFVFGVNRVLQKWKMLREELPEESRRAINLYVVNNPYPECMQYLPPPNSKYYPSCVTSTRTNPEFVKRYKGRLYHYEPTLDSGFGFNNRKMYHIDDYRNPVCAAIDLAFHFGVKKLMFLCCDNSFSDKREASINLENGLYTYPQHIRLQDIIEAKLFWLSKFKDREIKIGDYSSGRKYNIAEYIDTEEKAIEFFVNSEEI